jgi:hypothetical protein
MVSPKTRAVVWARGAGRCHFCNIPLIGDYISGNEDPNFGFVAHIVAEKATGPRGDAVRSPLAFEVFRVGHGQAGPHSERRSPPLAIQS